MPPRVEEYMSTPVIAVTPTDNLAHVRRLMVRHDVGCVVVVEGEEPVGIITKMEFVRVVVDQNMYSKPLDSILSREVMKREYPTVSPSNSIVDVARQMLRLRSNYALVRWVEGLGIISSTDLVRAYAEKYEGEALVRDYYSRDVPTVSRTHTLHYIAESIASSRHGRVIVVEGEKPVGIITETDLAFIEVSTPTLKRESYRKKFGRAPRGHLTVVRTYLVPLAEEIMTPNPETVGLNEDLAVAAKKMVDRDVGGLPVVDEEERLAGIITRLEILEALSRI